jgi:2-polyprenyl-6-methoxyphenol hydroxylase-like FAD-dependent oxidoreductase
VGLFPANECARRGLQWRRGEARSSQSEHSKALAIFPRALEILDMAGVVAPFLAVANRVTSGAIMAHGRASVHLRFTPEESPCPFVATVPRDVTERLLVETLQRKGGAVGYETALVSAVQHDDTVSASNHPREVVADPYVRCFGAELSERTLVPGDNARLRETRFEGWLSHPTSQRRPVPVIDPDYFLRLVSARV